MEGEIPNFVMVWTLVVASLTYCHTIGNLTSPGKTRLLFVLTGGASPVLTGLEPSLGDIFILAPPLFVLPVVLFFFYLPLHLTTIFLGGTSSFFLCLLANFKLLLFAFGKGPLSFDPPLAHFIPLACLPIKFRTDSEKKVQNVKKGQKSTLNYAVKALIFSTSIQVYHNKESIHPKIVMFLYAIYMYTGLEFIMAFVTVAARVFLGVDFEPQFDEPYLATSLQDFWGRRWNIMVNRILHPTVYEPVRDISIRLIGKEWAPLPAVLASFLVSALMHEFVFYYIGRTKPTWELTCFFLLHGVCLSVEITVKKAFRGSNWRLPAAVSGPLAMTFVVVTGSWLFLPSLMGRCQPDVMVYREYMAFLEFMKHVGDFLNVSRLKS